MKRFSFLAATALPLALVAQTPEPSKTVIRESRTFDVRISDKAAPSAGIFVQGSPAGGPVMFMTNLDGQIKGSPYSGDTVTESVQVLADGNRITRQNKSSFYRDSEGRTRRENTIQSLGPLGAAREPFTAIMIDDPVAGVHYNLDSKNKTARKMSLPDGIGMKMRQAIPAMPMIAGGGPGLAAPVPDVLFERSARPVGGAAGHVAGSVMTWSATVSDERRPANAKTEDLGVRMIEGVQAKGTRHTMTIAAGEVGNDRPIEVVTENWFSEQLKTSVLTIHKDPRFGETTTKLTNVRLGDPPRYMFEVPADYKVEDADVIIKKMGAPAKVKEILEEI